MTRFVLASASSGRRKVLRGAGIDPVVIVSGVDEDAIVAAMPADAGPGAVTVALATAKATAVLASLDPALTADCVVVGCDSMLFRDGRLWGKPPTADAAVRGWRAMAGSFGDLYTGHSLIRMRDGVIERRLTDHAVTRVNFGTPTEADLLEYVRSGEPTTVAGGFTLDGLGGWFVDGVSGDPSAVIGIGLPMIRQLLGTAGVSIADLWRANPVA